MRPLIRAITVTLAAVVIATTARAGIVYRAPASAPSATGAGTTVAWIGVDVTPLSDGWRDEWGYTAPGLLVTGLDPKGTGAQIGIETGDILVSIGETSLKNMEDLSVAHDRFDPTQATPVVIARQHGRMILIRNIEPVAVPAEPEPTSADATTDDSSSAAAAAGAAAAAAVATSDATVAPVPGDDLTALTTTADGAATSGDGSAGAVGGAAAVVGAAAAAGDAGGGASAEAWATFGATGADVNADLGAALGVASTNGVLVLTITPGGCAERAGIRAGDVITGASGHDVATCAALAPAFHDLNAGLTLHVLRRDAERDVVVTKSAAAPATAKAAAPATSAAPAQKSETSELLDETRALRHEIEMLRAKEHEAGGK